MSEKPLTNPPSPCDRCGAVGETELRRTFRYCVDRVACSKRAKLCEATRGRGIGVPRDRCSRPREHDGDHDFGDVRPPPSVPTGTTDQFLIGEARSSLARLRRHARTAADDLDFDYLSSALDDLEEQMGHPQTTEKK